MNHEEEDLTVYDVVVNHEEQYSIWAAGTGDSAGLEGRREEWAQARMSGIHPGSLDRHAAA